MFSSLRKFQQTKINNNKLPKSNIIFHLLIYCIIPLIMIANCILPLFNSNVVVKSISITTTTISQSLYNNNNKNLRSSVKVQNAFTNNLYPSSSSSSASSSGAGGLGMFQSSSFGNTGNLGGMTKRNKLEMSSSSSTSMHSSMNANNYYNNNKKKKNTIRHNHHHYHNFIGGNITKKHQITQQPPSLPTITLEYPEKMKSVTLQRLLKDGYINGVILPDLPYKYNQNKIDTYYKDVKEPCNRIITLSTHPFTDEKKLQKKIHEIVYYNNNNNNDNNNNNKPPIPTCGSLLFVSGNGKNLKSLTSIDGLRIANAMIAKGDLPKNIHLLCTDNIYSCSSNNNNNNNNNNKLSLGTTCEKRLLEKYHAGATAIITQPPLIYPLFKNWLHNLKLISSSSNNNNNNNMESNDEKEKTMKLIIGIPLPEKSSDLKFWMKLMNIPEVLWDNDFKKELTNFDNYNNNYNDNEKDKLVIKWTNDFIYKILQHFNNNINNDGSSNNNNSNIVTGIHLMPLQNWRYIEKIVTDKKEILNKKGGRGD